LTIRNQLYGLRRSLRRVVQELQSAQLQIEAVTMALEQIDERVAAQEREQEQQRLDSGEVPPAG